MTGTSYTYSQIVDVSGAVRADMVLRSDGVFVLTGKMAGPMGLVDVGVQGDPAPTLAYQDWLAGGNSPGEPAIPPRGIRGVLLVHALDKTTKVTARDLAYVAGLDAAREDMASIVRIAAVDGRTVSDWFDAALGLTS